MQSYECDRYENPPVEKDCQALGVIEKASHMHVDHLTFKCSKHETAFNRRYKYSAALLPNSGPYSDTNLSMEIVMDTLKIPYDSPDEKPDGLISLEFDLRGGKATQHKNIMELEAVITRTSL